jgi:glycogen debranching enzyme
VIARRITDPLGAPQDEREALGYDVAAASARAKGPERLVVKARNVFMVLDETGEIAPAGAADLGLYRSDTRFLSRLELRIDARRPAVLSSVTTGNALAICDLTQTGLEETLAFEAHYLHVRREVLVRERGYCERLRVTNYVGRDLAVRLDMLFGADFADLFEMRGVARKKRGEHFRVVCDRDGFLFRYRGLDRMVRGTLVELDPPPCACDAATGASYAVRLAPGETREIRIRVNTLLGDEAPEAAAPFEDLVAGVREDEERWRARATRVTTSDAIFDACLRQGETDVRTLVVEHGGGEVIAAGIPWYCVPFGRDSIIASIEALPIEPSIAVSTVRFLARFQGREVDNWREEEPGKIMHELRAGEMARCGEIPHTPYYGTADATPLFLILFDKVMRWVGDESLFEELAPAAEAALAWIDRYGDRDGDGFVEYERRCPLGLANQGWKDSDDAVPHEDGTLAPPPIALVEVQGYVYDAKRRLADLFRRRGEAARAAALEEEARVLREKIERAFWQEDLGTYAMALDGGKRPVRTLGSNMGHLLFARVPSAERAARVRDVLFSPQLWSGWGIRTLALGAAVWNPLAYHNGTVWPHDNALIADGLCRYGMRAHAARILRALYDAARHFRLYRLPELFCGLGRDGADLPVSYPVACSPQAWASGALGHIFFSMLGLRPRAFERKLHMESPNLPAMLSAAELKNLRVGGSRVAIRFARRGRHTSAHVHGREGEPLDVTVRFGER